MYGVMVWSKPLRFLAQITDDLTLLCLSVQVYLSSLTCIRDSADSILLMFINPCVTLFQTHQHPPCLDVLAACVELFGQQATARDSLTHALYAVCSAAEPMLRVSFSNI